MMDESRFCLPFWPDAENCSNSDIRLDMLTTINGIEADSIFSIFAQDGWIWPLLTEAHVNSFGFLEVLSHKAVSLHIHIQFFIAKLVLVS